jgi:hypothetical protein
MQMHTADETYTLGTVAAAVGVPRATLLSWVQRGRLEFLPWHTFGEARQFRRADVAYVAALAALAKHMDAIVAAEIMRKGMGGQPEYWPAHVERGFERIDVCVARYSGRPDFDAEVWFDDRNQVGIFIAEPEWGERMGDADAKAPARSTAVYSVGEAVSAALATLKCDQAAHE